MLSFFPRDVLNEILNLIESVSEGFLPTLTPVDGHNYVMQKNHYDVYPFSMLKPEEQSVSFVERVFPLWCLIQVILTKRNGF